MIDLGYRSHVRQALDDRGDPLSSALHCPEDTHPSLDAVAEMAKITAIQMLCVSLIN